MKLQISTAAIAALSSGPLFSIPDNVLLAHATESPLSPQAIYAANIHEYERYLKKKLRAKIALRKKSRGADTSSKDEVCTPVDLRLSKQYLDDGTADLGVLSSNYCIDPAQICVPDPLSSLGGRCLSRVMQQEGVFSKSTNSTLSNMNHMAGAECIPQDGSNEEDYDKVDLGILNGCNDPDHVCVEDASSPARGICVDSSSLTDNLDSNQNIRGHRRLLQCQYKNGTSGVKCTGNGACGGLSNDFISNKIGCGSCNGDSACAYMTEYGSIGEESCNAGGACQYLMPGRVLQADPKTITTIPSPPSTVLTVSDKSCNSYYACSLNRGVTEIGYYSCNGIDACKSLLGATKISEGSCNKDGSCKNLYGDTYIGPDSCYGCYSCANAQGTIRVEGQSCNNLQACSYLNGTMTFDTNSCNEAYSCKGVIGVASVGSGSCNGSRGCMNLSGNSIIRDEACNGSGACINFANGVTVEGKSCNAMLACISASDNLTVSYNSCNGAEACTELSGSYVYSLGSYSCNVNRACNKLTGAITIGSHSCMGQYACNKIYGTVDISDHSCHFGNACKQISGNARFGNHSCDGLNSCSYIEGYARVGDDSCLGIFACSAKQIGDNNCVVNVAANFTIGNGSCHGGIACGCETLDGTVIHDNSCHGDKACDKDKSNAVIYDGSCLGAYACAMLEGQTIIREDSCHGARSCMGSNLNLPDRRGLLSSPVILSVDKGSCIGDASCFGCVGSVTIGKESCDGFNACVYMTGLKTVIGDEACGGTTACGGLYSSQVGSYSCLGEGACVRCNSVETCISSGTPGPFTVGLGSCVGCYCCRGVSGTSVIGDNSCLYSNACEASSGNRIIGDSSCQGFKSCADTTGTVVIGSYACNDARACFSASDSVITNSPTTSNSPSSSPSSSPTASPSSSPTASPSSPPTASPTSRPSTSSPTSRPSTSSPTSRPSTSSPTSWAPTSSRPTFSPSSRPSGMESSAPTSKSDKDAKASKNAKDSKALQGFTIQVPTMSPSPLEACYPNAMKLKLESTTGQPIQLFEIEAFSAGINVAKNADAIQSTTFEQFYTSNVVDNDSATFSHTNDESPWLQVDLGKGFAIDSIKIANRWCGDINDMPGCLCRLANATLSLLDENDSTVTSVLLDDTCGQHSVETLFEPSSAFCSTKAKGKVPRYSWNQRVLRKRPTKC